MQRQMWDDRVFVNRQKEIRTLSNEFSEILDQMLVDRPVALDPKLIENVNGEEEDITQEEESEEDIDVTVNQNALLLMHEIDKMRKDTHELLTWFRPSVCRGNPRVKGIKQGVEHLYLFLESLRIRAENLLAVE